MQYFARCSRVDITFGDVWFAIGRATERNSDQFVFVTCLEVAWLIHIEIIREHVTVAAFEEQLQSAFLPFVFLILVPIDNSIVLDHAVFVWDYTNLVCSIFEVKF